MISVYNSTQLYNKLSLIALNMYNGAWFFCGIFSSGYSSHCLCSVIHFSSGTVERRKNVVCFCCWLNDERSQGFCVIVSPIVVIGKHDSNYFFTIVTAPSYSIGIRSGSRLRKSVYKPSTISSCTVCKSFRPSSDIIPKYSNFSSMFR